MSAVTLRNQLLVLGNPLGILSKLRKPPDDGRRCVELPLTWSGQSNFSSLGRNLKTKMCETSLLDFPVAFLKRRIQPPTRRVAVVSMSPHPLGGAYHVTIFEECVHRCS
jgi:hypothetical protein